VNISANFLQQMEVGASSTVTRSPAMIEPQEELESGSRQINEHGLPVRGRREAARLEVLDVQRFFTPRYLMERHHRDDDRASDSAKALYGRPGTIEESGHDRQLESQAKRCIVKRLNVKHPESGAAARRANWQTVVIQLSRRPPFSSDRGGRSSAGILVTVLLAPPRDSAAGSLA